MKDINTGIYFECVEGLEEQNGNSEAVQLVETAEAATTPQAWGAKERGRIYSQEAVATLLRFPKTLTSVSWREKPRPRGRGVALQRIIMTSMKCILYKSLCQMLTDSSQQPKRWVQLLSPHFTNGKTEAQKVKFLVQRYTASQCLPYEIGGT